MDTMCEPTTGRVQPEWLDVSLPFDQAVPGLPDFASPEWFERSVRLSPTETRNVHDAIVKKRRLNPAFLSWWPASVKANSIFWCFARAGVVPSDSVTLCSVVASVCSRTKGQMVHRRPSALREVRYRNGLVPYGENGRNADLRKEENAFVRIYEEGAAGLSEVLESFLVRYKDMEVPPVVMWGMERHPEGCILFDEEMQRRAVREADRERRRNEIVLASQIAAGPAAREDRPVDEIDELRRLVATLDAERRAALDDLADLNQRHVDLQRDIAAVRAGHDPLHAYVTDPDALPETMPELLEWIERRLPPTVHVLPRAFRMLKKASEVDVRRLARGLRFLRDVYVPWRCDEGITYDEYVAAQVECGFDETQSFTGDGALEAHAEYRVTWNGRTVHLDRHLKRGYGTDLKVMMRIYFHWDRTTRTVVVGGMPDHMLNRIA